MSQSRVVNIKIASTDDLILSIRTGRYSMPEQVGKRISQVWRLLQYTPSAKVLFLFSIGGHKQYCGLAEVPGPWSRSERLCDQVDDGNALGSFPVRWTWHYVKNVPFCYFAHLGQDPNTSVGNTWSGLAFPETLGRKVVERYVQAPAVSTVLARPVGPFPHSPAEHAPTVPSSGAGSFSGPLSRGDDNPSVEERTRRRVSPWEWDAELVASVDRLVSSPRMR